MCDRYDCIVEEIGRERGDHHAVVVGEGERVLFKGRSRVLLSTCLCKELFSSLIGGSH